MTDKNLCRKCGLPKEYASRRWRCRSCERQWRKDPAVRASLHEYSVRYEAKRRDQRNAERRERYKNDPVYRELRFQKHKRNKLANRERINAQRRERRRADPAYRAREIERNKRYKLANREKIKNYKLTNREWTNINQQQRRKDPIVRARIAEREKHYRIVAPDRYKAKNRRHNQRKKSTPEGRLRHRMQNHLRRALKRGWKKSGGSSFAFLGYTPAELRMHIERKFVDGMCWERFTEIDIDHIQPLACFDLSKDEEIRKAWALENLQPLWRSEHVKKGSVYNGIRHRHVRHISPAGRPCPQGID